MSQQIKIEYSNQHNLHKTIYGSANPILLSLNAFEGVFDKGFLAKPSKPDIREFETNFKIRWSFYEEFGELNPLSDLSEDKPDWVKEKIDKNQDKLLSRLDELNSKRKNNDMTNEEDDQRNLLKNISINFKNIPNQDIYINEETKDLSIVNWGFSQKGSDLPYTVEKINENDIENENDDEESSTEDNGGFEEEGQEVGTEEIEEEEESSFFDKLGESIKNWWNRFKRWFKKNWRWLLLVLILLLVFKNCQPKAIITRSIDEPKYITFIADKSHDENSFFSRGLLKETSKEDLIKRWLLFRLEESPSGDSKNKIPIESGEQFTYKKVIPGQYLIILEVEDSGNLLGFWKRKDKDSYTFTITEDLVSENLKKIDIESHITNTIFDSLKSKILKNDDIMGHLENRINEPPDSLYAPIDKDEDLAEMETLPPLSNEGLSDNQNQTSPEERNSNQSQNPDSQENQQDNPPPEDKPQPTHDDGLQPGQSREDFTEKEITTALEGEWKGWRKIITKRKVNGEWRILKEEFLTPNGLKVDNLHQDI